MKQPPALIANEGLLRSYVRNAHVSGARVMPQEVSALLASLECWAETSFTIGTEALAGR